MDLEEKLEELLTGMRLLAKPLGGLILRKNKIGCFISIGRGLQFDSDFLKANIERKTYPGTIWTSEDIRDLADKIIDFMIESEYRMFSKKEFMIDCFLEKHQRIENVSRLIFEGKLFIEYRVRDDIGNKTVVTKRFLKYIGMTENQFLLKYRDCEMAEIETTIKLINAGLVRAKTVNRYGIAQCLLAPKLIKRIGKKIQSPFVLVQEDWDSAVAAEISCICEWVGESGMKVLKSEIIEEFFYKRGIYSYELRPRFFYCDPKAGTVSLLETKN